MSITAKVIKIKNLFHKKGFNQFVDTETIQHFLYRDFPDNLNKPKLTETNKQFTIKEIVEATKRVDPDIW